jgi:hypothetical protein
MDMPSAINMGGRLSMGLWLSGCGLWAAAAAAGCWAAGCWAAAVIWLWSALWSVSYLPTACAYGLHPKFDFKKHGNGTHPPICFLFKCVFLGATHQCQGTLAVSFRGNCLELLRFLALSLFD